METFKIEHLNFAYPGKEEPALRDICLVVGQGEFVTLCGKSGCGKSTLLRHLKPVLTPHGRCSGDIFFEGRLLTQLTERDQAEKIGFVLQSPDNQIVTDKVWHELAFGLESLGMDTPAIRLRVAEMASFFGIQTWFHKNVAELSGGQKQLLNLASVMVMQPSVLILDEPTSQLDPIAAADFLETIAKINRELGTTILLTEHRLEDALPLSDRAVVMDRGAILTDGSPQEAGRLLKEKKHHMFLAMPTPMRVYAGVESSLPCPVTVRDGRQWLTKVAAEKTLDRKAIPPADTGRADLCGETPVIQLSEVWFRYEEGLPDVLKGLSMNVGRGELYAIVGGNGTGKTTSISVMTGLLRPWRGKVRIKGKEIFSDADGKNGLYGGILGILPQNPQALFVKKTVEADLAEMLSGHMYSREERRRRIEDVTALCELEELLSMHPYDLSGGEQQRAALAKVLLLEPEILVLDEPTKGLDAHFKQKLAHILDRLRQKGVTVVMVSHDIEFCARYADRCAMFFDGSITGEDCPRRFFSGKSFYTTSANRMARTLLPEAVLAEDIIGACGGEVYQAGDTEVNFEWEIPARETQEPRNTGPEAESWTGSPEEEGEPAEIEKADGLQVSAFERKRLSPMRILSGIFFAGAFIATFLLLKDRWPDWRDYAVQFTMMVELGGCLASLLPGKELDAPVHIVQTPREKRKLSRRTIAGSFMILLAIPLTLYVGVFYLEDRKYYFISMLILLETMLPFAMVFEDRRPQARELIVISVLAAIGVAGRAAFFMLPQFKPVLAVVILAGVCFGGEAGFLVGAVTMFVSNMMFSQGPWTPWQMFSAGIIGFLAGILFRKGFLRKRRSSLCIFGLLSAFFIYGIIMDSASALMWQSKPTWPVFLIYYAQGLPFNIIHGIATVFFLWFISGPIIEKLDRIKVKYGLVE
ncbi:energy-coupling factor transporter ATPase [Bacilliculturomica massiliensis]|uniref:energy-coupling factor transporter ATPase n=1 Tax=Bacilliculturomica massiliensis TaxID=1917867 RepID=UPI00102FC685|nr:energy-coupling factor transporter ATPase [Bacilliculturomica massiliensis]